MNGLRARAVATLAVVVSLVVPPSARAETVAVAAAANLRAALEPLIDTFEATRPGATLRISTGATGLLAAQIRQGAPFDVFLAADVERPEALATDGFAAAAAAPAVYAAGALVVFADEAGLRLGPASLASARLIAIANPRTAPYGAAAAALLDHFEIDAAGRIAQAPNVAGAYAAVLSGAADLGIVALSTVRAAQSIDPDAARSIWIAPRGTHPPIRQALLLLRRGGDNPAARAFVDFMLGDRAQAILRDVGYVAP